MAKFKPYAIRDLFGTVKMERVVCAETFGGVRVIYRPLVMPGLGFGVMDTSILDHRLPDGVHPHYERSNKPLHSILASIKESLLLHGGTPEAVRLLLELMPLTTKELTMAKEKLAGKAAPVKAAAEPKSTKAKSTPGKTGTTLDATAKDKVKAVATAEPKTKKTLPPALAKAAEAKKAAASANDGKKLKVLAKTNPYREGTKAAATFDHFKAFNGKTVGEMKEASDSDAHDLGYVRYAARDGHISIG